MPRQREVFTRPPMERMMRIHRIIENKEYPNAKQLAKELEVSLRTVKRDLVFMRNRLKLPMEFDGKRNGHYFTEPVPNFPQVPMTEREMWHLFIASQAIEQYRGTPLAGNMKPRVHENRGANSARRDGRHRTSPGRKPWETVRKNRGGP